VEAVADASPDRPSFTYYEDPYADGTLEPSEDECSVCGRRRGLISTSVVYGTEVTEDSAICPWCIADGSAHSKFGAQFNLVGTQAPQAAQDEVAFRTPGFVRWQDWDWPSHCDDLGVYRGQPSGSELRADPEALDALLGDLRQWDWGRDAAYVEEFVDGLGGSQVAYLFRCRHCGRPLVVWDQD
jgi:uncharacterized protein